MTQQKKKIKHVRCARWAHEMLYRPARRKVLKGGRGGGKSYEIAQALVLLVSQGKNNYFGRPLKILLCREIQKSIRDSALFEIAKAIDRMELDGFNVMKHEIRHENGSYFFTCGLSNVTDSTIKSMSNVDIVWVEEAQAIRRRSLELLEPTIRKPDSEIWFSMNPTSRGDAVFRKYCTNRTGDTKNILVRHVNMSDNVAPKEDLAELYRQREETRLLEPDRYKHIWLGEPDDSAGARKLLPWADLQQCLHRRGCEGAVFAGLDIAGKGSDFNALTIRQGACIIHHSRWNGTRINDTVRRAVSVCTEFGVYKLFFDETGLGEGAASTLSDMNPGFRWEGINFGQAVAAPNAFWGMRGDQKVKQKDKFERRTGQMGAALRMRLQATLAYLGGNKKVDVSDDCLWIDPKAGTRHDMEDLLIDLSQPEERETKNGKMFVEKQPVPEGSSSEPDSPDSYDGTILAYAPDSKYGLQRIRWVA